MFLKAYLVNKQFLINFLSGGFFNSVLKYTIILKYGSLDFSQATSVKYTISDFIYSEIICEMIKLFLL